MADPLMRRLAELPPATADGRRDDEVRRRCHARLAREVRRRQESQQTLPSPSPIAWQPLVASLAFVYLATVIVQALDWYRR